MTFDSRESSRIAGHPIHLYTFRFGPEEESVRHYTSIAEGFTYDAVLYEPIPIKHSDVVSSGNLDRSTLQVRMPDNTFIGQLYNGEPPSNVVSLIIRQGHLADGDFKVCWAGKVLGNSFEEHELVLDCEPISSSLRRVGLTRNYQYGCPLVLYGPACRANKAAATSVVEVVSVDGPLVTLPSDWSDKKDKYLGGIAEWTNPDGRKVRRSIIKIESSTVILLSSLADGLEAAADLTVIYGCNHEHGITDDDGDCKNLHDNILNFGGQHEIPLKNPVGITNNYY